MPETSKIGLHRPMSLWAVATASVVLGVLPIGHVAFAESSVNYVEGASAVVLDSAWAGLSGTKDYTGHSVSWSVQGASSAETLNFVRGSKADADQVGEVVVDESGSIWKGVGDPVVPTLIGNITSSGSGNALTVTFGNAFSNGDFEESGSGSTDGWTLNKSRIYLGYYTEPATGDPVAVSAVDPDSGAAITIGGFAPPLDFYFPPGASGFRLGQKNTGVASNSLETNEINVNWDIGALDTQDFSVLEAAQEPARGQPDDTSYWLKLRSVLNSTDSYALARGPWAISNSGVYLAAGDQLSFDWVADGAGDAFDVYGYLLNVETGKAVRLIDEFWKDQRSARGRVSLTLGEDNSREVAFYNLNDPNRTGSTQTKRTDGRLLDPGADTLAWSARGASTTNTYDDSKFTDGSSFQAGTYKFVFINGSYDDSGGEALGSTFAIDNISVTSTTESASLDDVLALGKLVTYSATSGSTGTRSVNYSSVDDGGNEDDASRAFATVNFTGVNDAPVLEAVDTIEFSDTADFDSPNDVLRSLSATDEEGDTITYGPASLTGSYGSLSVNPSTGALVFSPDDEAINALDADDSETFTLTATDGEATGTVTLTVSISATVDDAPSAPSISSIASGDKSLSVSFTPPTSAGSSAIENYKYSTDGINYRELSSPQTTGPILVTTLSSDGSTPLVNGTAYSITIKAVNASDDSPASNSVSGTPQKPTVSTDQRTRTTDPAPVVVTPPVVQPRAFTPPQLVTPPVQSGPVLRNGVPPAPPSVPQALVGGRPTTLTTTVPTTTQLDVKAGNLNLGVKVLEDQGQITKAPDGTTEISVRKGASATVSGSGFRPGATVQVFMPLAGDNAKELTRIPVSPDGSFDGSAPFATRPNEAPLPIGKNVLQLVSLDNDGNQVVVEMAVNIAQGSPAPEQNRIEGVIPTMTPGQSIATSGGEPVPVRITPVSEQKLAVVEGDGWSMAVNVDSETGGVEPSAGGALLKLVRNESALVSGSGFMPGTRADVWLFSDPTLLGTVTIDENGEFTGEVNIDPNMIPVGEHTLQLQGVGEDGYVKAANLGVLVDDPVEAMPTAVETGLGFIWWIIAAVVLIALVIVLLASRRRRES